MTPARLLRRGLRRLVGWWWQSARPATGATVGGSGAPARPLHEAGRAPSSDERWLPTAPATGPWAKVDPHASGRWPRRTSLAVVALWGAAVGWRVRRDVQGWNAPE